MLGLKPALAAMLWIAPALAQTNFTPREESPEEFVAAPGRDETFYACTACHGFKLVAQQGLSRARWEDSHQPDGPPPQHACARRQGSRHSSRLSRSGVSAARARGTRQLAESRLPSEFAAVSE